MKKFKFIMPILAFVVAITVAFALPIEDETSSKIETSDFPVTVNTNLSGCPTCDLIGTNDCNGGETICQCSYQGNTVPAYNEGCTSVLKRE